VAAGGELLDQPQPLHVVPRIQPLTGGGFRRGDDAVATLPDAQRGHRQARQAGGGAAAQAGIGGDGIGNESVIGVSQQR